MCFAMIFDRVGRNPGDRMNYNEAAERLRDVIRTGTVSLTAVTENPARFFEAHRLLSVNSTRLGPGFGIRMTVHFNLFAGTVVGLGTPAQLAALEARNAKSPRLGCFGLTERLAVRKLAVATCLCSIGVCVEILCDGL
jgi:acyl-CoA oxidase